MDLTKYNTWFFDCDGVLIDSNWVKTKAFHRIGMLYGECAARKFVMLHKEMGGVTRYEKINKFVFEVLKEDINDKTVQMLVDEFGKECARLLTGCRETQGALKFLARVIGSGKDIFVVSGGKQEEVDNVLRLRGLHKNFKGVYGSPRTKNEIISSIREEGYLEPAIFVGDAKYDYEVSVENNMDFIFVSGYTNMYDWRSYFADKNITIIHNLSELL